jgi:hypothetical protein
MAGQLCWIPKFGGKGKLALHLRFESFHPWKPYTAFPGLCVPDYPISGGSAGWATYTAGTTIVCWRSLSPGESTYEQFNQSI